MKDFGMSFFGVILVFLSFFTMIAGGGGATYAQSRLNWLQMPKNLLIVRG